MYVKVKLQSKQTVYLEQAKVIAKGGHKFISGTQVDSQGETVIKKGGTTLHLIQLGEGVTVKPMEFDKFYGTFQVEKNGKVEGL
jgi:hypothetical protein